MLSPKHVGILITWSIQTEICAETKGNTILTLRKSLGKQRRLDVNVKTDVMEIQCLDSKHMALARIVKWVFCGV